jgi:hypothetical protein
MEERTRKVKAETSNSPSHQHTYLLGVSPFTEYFRGRGHKVEKCLTITVALALGWHKGKDSGLLNYTRSY